MDRKLITAAVAASALIALTACGSADTKTTVRTTPAVSASTSSDSQPMSSSMAVKGGVVDGQMLGAMMVDAMVSSKTAHATLVGATVSGEGDFELGSPGRTAITMTMQRMKMRVIQVGGFVYIKGIP
ncbi:MAG: hypothetical protein QOE58_3095, partial [Actinomycetota bacterium]|nr:hypothetical protein [Actinomycetota bacterium]